VGVRPENEGFLGFTHKGDRTRPFAQFRTCDLILMYGIRGSRRGAKMAGIREIPCYFPCRQGIGTCSNSAETGLLEIIIGLDDLAQLVFRGAIAAIGVGVMAFHQLLEIGP